MPIYIGPINFLFSYRLYDEHGIDLEEKEQETRILFLLPPRQQKGNRKSITFSVLGSSTLYRAYLPLRLSSSFCRAANLVPSLRQ